MIRSHLARLVFAVAASAVGADCGYVEGAVTTMRVCVAATTVVVDRRSEDFSGSCGASPCDARVEGAASYVDSLLPGDRALAIDPGTRVAFRWTLMGAVEGSTLSFNARCDGGGILRSGGDRVTDAPLATEWQVGGAWTRQEWPMRTAYDTHDSSSTAFAGSTEVEVTLTNAGHSRCYVDRLRYVTSARVCTEHREITTQEPGRWCPTAWDCRDAGAPRPADTGTRPRVDVGF